MHQYEYFHWYLICNQLEVFLPIVAQTEPRWFEGAGLNHTWTAQLQKHPSGTAHPPGKIKSTVMWKGLLWLARYRIGKHIKSCK